MKAFMLVSLICFFSGCASLVRDVEVEAAKGLEAAINQDVVRTTPPPAPSPNTVPAK